MTKTDRPVKCPGCEQYFKRSEYKFIYRKNRYWHDTCYEKVETKEENKKKLIRYIEQLLNKKIDYKIKNQLNNYINNKNYNYEDIYNALYYFYQIQNNSTAKANGGIGIVPYVIEEAKNYFENRKNIAARTKDVILITEQKRITIDDPTKKEKYKEEKYIDIKEI